ncbi:MAG: efflux transporter periplasmic adaptor subunit [Porticoccaceae bacterium]|nr:efflux transporter periplasmic adaptor subunit [Porticoccaceae bacterium]
MHYFNARARCVVYRLLVAVLIGSLVGCGDYGEPTAGGSIPNVGVMIAEPRLVTLSSELSGRLEPWRIAEVRAQVSGIVLKRLFREGSDVKAGDELFRIDPAPYRAAVQQAQSNLAVANANLLIAKAQYDRIAALGKVKAVSELDEITAQASYKQAEAEVEAAEAALESARIDLEYATVKAPISGRIGRSLVTEGALVGQGEATHLATIQQIHPIYASFNQSAREALSLRRFYAEGALNLNPDKSIPVRLRLEDGSEYPHTGSLLFGELTVERSTGQINFRAQFPNSEGMLLPGMYVRAIMEQGRYPNAILVPQQAVTRGDNVDTLWVVDEDQKVAVREVEIAGSKGNQWIVTGGVAAGDRVVVDGFFKAAPGAQVTPVIVSFEEHDTGNEQGSGE